VRVLKTDSGNTQRIVTTTMGAATDMVHPGLRRFIVNTTYHACGLQVPAKLDADPVGEFKPSPFGFKTYRKGLKPADLK
jgi:hypothetical protein